MKVGMNLIGQETFLLLLPALLLFQEVLQGESARNRSRSSTMSDHRVIDQLLHYYDRSEPPPGEPTKVEIGMYVNQFEQLSENTGDFTLTMYLRQQWTDSRLRFKPTSGLKNQKVRMGDGRWNEIWTPDLSFRNEKSGFFHHLTSNNRLLFLHASGRLWYVTRLTVTLTCSMSGYTFPLDTQTCPIIFESIGYTPEEVDFQWLNRPVEIDRYVTVPDYTLTNYSLTRCSQNYSTGGSLACLQADFILKRDVGFYMMYLYIPSIFYVILSWVPFWISLKAVPARLAIGLVAVIAMFMQSPDAGPHLPPGAYINSFQLWIYVCLGFVFVALFECSVIHELTKTDISPEGGESLKEQPEGGDSLREQPGGGESSKEKPGEEAEGIELKEMTAKNADQDSKEVEKREKRAQNIDKISRILFPAGFFLFNLIYWLVSTLA